MGERGAVTRCEQGRGFRLTRNSCQTSKLAARLTALRTCTGTWLPALLMVTDRAAFLQNAAHILGRLHGHVDAGRVIVTAAQAPAAVPLPLLQTVSHRGGLSPLQWLGEWHIVSDSCKAHLLCIQVSSER